MAKSLMLLVLCFKVKVMHWVKAISHFKPAVVGPYQSRSSKLIYNILAHTVSPPSDAPQHHDFNRVVFC